MSLFMINYRRELRIGADIRRKEKVEEAVEFAKSIEESWGSVEKDIEEDKETSRQRKKAGWGTEKRR